MLVTEERYVFSFGCNINGRLGINDHHSNNICVPCKLDLKYKIKNNFIQISLDNWKSIHISNCTITSFWNGTHRVR